jgi:predicted membrane protein
VVIPASPQHRQSSRVVFGLFVVAFGVAALLQNLGVVPADLLQTWWPLVFVGLGVVRLVQRPGAHAVVFSLGLVTLGALMIASNLGVLHFHARDWWPLLIIFIGGSVIARAFSPGGAERWGRRRGHLHDERLEHGARIEASAVMSGIVLRNDSQDFQGGSISTVMGSVEVDLRQAAMAAGQATLHLSIVMGGVEIKVPREWSVAIVGTPTLGGIEDRTLPPLVPGPRLVIEGSVVMGGVEISN